MAEVETHPATDLLCCVGESTGAQLDRGASIGLLIPLTLPMWLSSGTWLSTGIKSERSGLTGGHCSEETRSLCPSNTPSTAQ